MVNKICHLTSVHPITDIRIFEKECSSLAANGFDVTLIACGETAFEDIKNGVKRISLFVPVNNRLNRIRQRSKAVYKKALEVDAEIYHFHDPELIPTGLKLRRKGKKVIYDSHEDVPNQILSKEWIPFYLRKIISLVYAKYERLKLKKMNALISVTPSLTYRLKKLNPNTIEITNYPLIEEIQPDNRKWGKSICFTGGGIAKQWMHANVIKALDSTDGITYEIAGNIDEAYFRELAKLKSWSKVNLIGKIPFNQVRTFISNSSVGIALNDYNANVGFKMGSLGNTKLFEYMQAGTPVICTDFILWKEIIEKYNCGICVNPRDISEISNAIQYLFYNPKIAKKMGNNGRNAINNSLNWRSQEIKLIKLYNILIES